MGPSPRHQRTLAAAGEQSRGWRRLDTITILLRSSDPASTTPIMSSGLEILAGHPKDLPLGTFRPPLPSSVMDLNPAFR